MSFKMYKTLPLLHKVWKPLFGFGSSLLSDVPRLCHRLVRYRSVFSKTCNHTKLPYLPVRFSVAIINMDWKNSTGNGSITVRGGPITVRRVNEEEVLASILKTIDSHKLHPVDFSVANCLQALNLMQKDVCGEDMKDIPWLGGDDQPYDRLQLTGELDVYRDGISNHPVVKDIVEYLELHVQDLDTEQKVNLFRSLSFLGLTSLHLTQELFFVLRDPEVHLDLHLLGILSSCQRIVEGRRDIYSSYLAARLQVLVQSGLKVKPDKQTLLDLLSISDALNFYNTEVELWVRQKTYDIALETNCFDDLEVHLKFLYYFHRSISAYIEDGLKSKQYILLFKKMVEWMSRNLSLLRPAQLSTMFRSARRLGLHGTVIKPIQPQINDQVARYIDLEASLTVSDVVQLLFCLYNCKGSPMEARLLEAVRNNFHLAGDSFFVGYAPMMLRSKKRNWFKQPQLQQFEEKLVIEQLHLAPTVVLSYFRGNQLEIPEETKLKFRNALENLLKSSDIDVQLSCLYVSSLLTLYDEELPARAIERLRRLLPRASTRTLIFVIKKLYSFEPKKSPVCVNQAFSLIIEVEFYLEKKLKGNVPFRDVHYIIFENLFKESQNGLSKISRTALLMLLPHLCRFTKQMTEGHLYPLIRFIDHLQLFDEQLCKDIVKFFLESSVETRNVGAAIGLCRYLRRRTILPLPYFQELKEAFIKICDHMASSLYTDRDCRKITVMLNFINDLISLQIYPDETLKKIFTPRFFAFLDENAYQQPSYRRMFMQNLMMINRSVCLHRPDLDFPWIFAKLSPDDIVRPPVPDEYMAWAESFLDDALGGKNFYRKKSLSKYFHDIDIECQLDSSGRAVKYEDAVSEDEKGVDKQMTPVALFLRSVEQQVRIHQLNKRELELLGYKVIDVFPFEIRNLQLTYEETVDYFRKSIMG